MVEAVDEGNDTVYSLAHPTLAANVETLILQGSADLQGYGNASVNELSGNIGNNILNGHGGADYMVGGAGNDAYFVDDAGVVLYESADDGNDTVYSVAHRTLAANVENLILRGSADLQGYGNAGVNALYGNSGNNTLNGYGGADALTGNGGLDTFVFNAGETNGDIIMDFDGAGSGSGDQLMFVGFGAGAYLEQINATVWQINYDGGTAYEQFTLANAANVHSSDF